MSKYIKQNIAKFVAWIIVLILGIVMLPNISGLVADKGQTKIPDSAKSQVAKTIQKDWGHKISNTRQVVVVFNNGDQALTTKQKERINQTIDQLKDDKTKYDIKGVTAPNDSDATKKQLISKDKSTQLVQLDVGKRDTVRKMNQKLIKEVKTSGVKTYITGSDILNDDFSVAIQEGLKKTEVIAIIFILIVLILVFRSPIVPLISLGTVGLSFIVALSAVMNLAKYTGFTISNFTQVFMVVVMFGIGTDYNILLYNQFKNDLIEGMDKEEATKHSIKVAGKTILYSGSTVLLGFLTLALAKFSIYRSATGVGIGVAILLLALLTVNPFFMSLLGNKVFWPSHNSKESNHSKLWSWLSGHSAKNPLIALGIIVILAIPMLLTYNNKLNYDTVVELPSDYSAKQGFKTVQKHFSKGTAEPTTIYIKSDQKLDNESDLRVIDNLTNQIKGIDGIKTVASVTQPGGDKIDQLYVNDQLKTLTSQTSKAQAGLKELQKGLTGGDFDASQLEDIGAKATLIGKELKSIQATSGEQLMTALQQKMTAAGQPLSQQQMAILTGAASQEMASVSSMQTRLQAIATYTQAIGNDAQSLGNELKGQQQKMASAGSSVGKLNDGLSESNDYLKELQDSSASNTLFVPKSVLESDTFKDSENVYLSSDKKAAKITVVLDSDPLTSKSIKKVESLETMVNNSVKGTSLKNASVSIGGQTSETSDTSSIAKQDFLRSAVIMLIGITVALMFVTRSILQPFYIIASLLLAYVGGLGITRFISSTFLGENLLGWNVPFFTFVMLVALGVDYSIFLMMKYREFGNEDPGDRIVKSAGIIGTVVISAAIILGGTFAALMPAGVLTLTQVAIGVISGLVILVFLIPAMNSSLIRLTYPRKD
jgi:RND superfamily putative drug exporter